MFFNINVNKVLWMQAVPLNIHCGTGLVWMSAIIEYKAALLRDN